MAAFESRRCELPEGGYFDLFLGWLTGREFGSRFYALVRLLLCGWGTDISLEEPVGFVFRRKGRDRKKRERPWSAGGLLVEGRDWDCGTFALTCWGIAGKTHR